MGGRLVKSDFITHSGSHQSSAWIQNPSWSRVWQKSLQQKSDIALPDSQVVSSNSMSSFTMWPVLVGCGWSLLIPINFRLFPLVTPGSGCCDITGLALNTGTLGVSAGQTKLVTSRIVHSTFPLLPILPSSAKPSLSPSWQLQPSWLSKALFCISPTPPPMPVDSSSAKHIVSLE